MEPYKILIVDDSPDVLKAIEMILRAEYKVFTASSGLNALEIMETETDIALVISDQRMANMTGIELMEMLVKAYPHTVRILITAYAETDVFMKAINLGHIYGFISKPWKTGELISIVRKGIKHYEMKQVLKEPHIRALLYTGIISSDQLDSVIQAAENDAGSIEEASAKSGIANPQERRKYGGSRSLTEIIVEKGYADEDTVLEGYALELGIPYIPLMQFPINEQLAELLPLELAYKHTMVPVDAVDKTIVLAASEPLSEKARFGVEEKTGKRVMIVLSRQRDIEELLLGYDKNKPTLSEISHEKLKDEDEGALANA